MTPKHLEFLEKYYEFAEKCCDDYEIMCKAIKLAGCDRRPNVIIKNLELMGVDSEYKDYYSDIISSITDSMIDRARWSVQLERGKAPTLF